MEIKATPWPRIAPWLMLLVVAYAFGRWHARDDRWDSDAVKGEADVAQYTEDARPDPLTTLEQIIAASEGALDTESRIAAIFADVSVDEIAAISRQLHELPASRERETLLLTALRRWAELAPPRAIDEANAITALPLRADARSAVYETWGKHDPKAAFAAAQAEDQVGDRLRATSASLVGIATRSATEAVGLWILTPETYRLGPAGRDAVNQMTSAACDSGQREALQEILARLPAGEERELMSSAVARHWGRYEPDAAVAWLKAVTPAGAMQDSMIDEIFSAFVRKDPVAAAAWAATQTDERRRSNYVAVAVAAWAAFDSAGAEMWVNEQQYGSYLDGATSAIAAHFIEHRLWPQAFAWTRRILRNEARADLLGNLGRIWNAERPEEFNTFLAETSLNRAESEMLRSKIMNVAAPP